MGIVEHKCIRSFTYDLVETFFNVIPLEVKKEFSCWSYSLLNIHITQIQILLVKILLRSLFLVDSGNLGFIS